MEVQDPLSLGSTWVLAPVRKQPLGNVSARVDVAYAPQFTTAQPTPSTAHLLMIRLALRKKGLCTGVWGRLWQCHWLINYPIIGNLADPFVG